MSNQAKVQAALAFRPSLIGRVQCQRLQHKPRPVFARVPEATWRERSAGLALRVQEVHKVRESSFVE
jgi:hypothetical protein